MLRHILTVCLIVVVAYCVALPSSGKPIPINSQGGNFPVPFVSKQNDGDFYDDIYYPEIDDESINSVVRDNGGKGGDRGSQSNVPGGVSRPSGSPTSGRRPSQSPRGESRPSASATSGRRPSQSPCGESRPSASPTSGRRPLQSPGGESPTPSGFPSRGGALLPNSGEKSRPSATSDGSGWSPRGGLDSSFRQNPRQKGRGQNRKQPDLSQYRNAPAISTFVTGLIDSGKVPDKVKMFKTNNPTEVIEKGNVGDKFEVEIIEGPDDLNLRQSTIVGHGTRLTLENPTGATVIGRVKTYKA